MASNVSKTRCGGSRSLSIYSPYYHMSCESQSNSFKRFRNGGDCGWLCTQKKYNIASREASIADHMVLRVIRGGASSSYINHCTPLWCTVLHTLRIDLRQSITALRLWLAISYPIVCDNVYVCLTWCRLCSHKPTSQLTWCELLRHIASAGPTLLALSAYHSTRDF